ncbi:MAG: fumarate hydratase, partial [Bacillota bacterium]
GYIEGYLRKSVVDDPLIKRINTKDNTPAVIHTTVVPGDKLKITVAPKGGGAENCSAIKMMTPSDGYNGVKKFVIDTVLKAGPNPCPPIVVGVGIGGNFEKAAFLAKKALIRPLNQNHPDPQFAALEKELLEEINELGIGPQGFGGRITALKVNVETFPCHIASMPVAVNINCHSTRHKSAVL